MNKLWYHFIVQIYSLPSVFQAVLFAYMICGARGEVSKEVRAIDSTVHESEHFMNYCQDTVLHSSCPNSETRTK